jgi:acetyl esterase/lipase
LRMPIRSNRFRDLCRLNFVVTLAASGAVEAQTVDVHRDVVYGHSDGMAMVYDVTVPREDANGAGVVFVISGGFLSSVQQQEMIAPVAQPLLDAGFTVFNLRHPSTPRYMAPEIYEAVQVGMAHVLANSTRFGVDPSRIGTLGMSTGGLLSLLLALDHPATSASARGERPAAAVAYMPIADIRPHVGNVRTTPSLDFSPALAPSLSPVDFVSRDDPPVLMIHGNRDTIVGMEENSGRLRRLLSAQDVASDLLVIDGGHELFAGLEKERADRAAVEWFRTHLLE